MISNRTKLRRYDVLKVGLIKPWRLQFGGSHSIASVGEQGPVRGALSITCPTRVAASKGENID
jgi:hypothetical protein